MVDLLLITAAVLFILLLVYGYLSNGMLTVEHYPLTVWGEGEPVKVVMLADLHGSMFGSDNRRLIQRIQREAPDIICMAGDMTVKNGKGTDSCLALCRELLQICPVFYAPGNHEIRMECYEQFIDELKKAGVVWLDNAHRDLVVRSRRIRVYGLNLEEELYHKFWRKTEFDSSGMESYLGAAGKEYFNLLLAHNPEYFKEYQEWGADLVLSGHVHGGIARLPLFGGVIAPSLQLFPAYDAGLFQRGKSRMVLTRGLGTHHIRLRFFNTPEISVINLS